MSQTEISPMTQATMAESKSVRLLTVGAGIALRK